MNRKEICAIALGANLGSPEQTLESAIQSLAETTAVHLIVRSALYQSQAVGPSAQPDYINAVALFEVGLEPLALLDVLLALEVKHGRVRGGERWGARMLDLDLITYGDRTIHHDRLIVPHPHAHHRCFVLQPLAEIAPGFEIPGHGEVSTLLENCDTGPAVALATPGLLQQPGL